MTSRSVSLAALLVAAALAGGAHADTVILRETVDLRAPMIGIVPGSFGWNGFASAGGAFSPDFSFPLYAGDNLDFTAKFLPGQSLTLTQPTGFWLFSFADQDATVNATGTMTLLDTAGDPILTSNTKTDDEGVIHFGQFFGVGDFASLPNTVTLGGLHYVATLNSYDSGVVFRTYDGPNVFFDATAVVVDSTPSATPEPSAWLLMLGGVFGAGAVLRRRRRLFAA